MDMNQYLEIFIEESQEHLQSLNQSLLGLETNPKDMEKLNEIFRVAHTIKGMAGTMGFSKMTKLTHQMENVLDSIRNGKTEVTTLTVDVLFECLDFLENSVNNIANNGQEGNDSADEIVTKLNNILSGDKANVEIVESIKVKSSDSEVMRFNQYDNGVIAKALEQGYNVFKIKIVLDKGCMLKSARSFIVFQTIERHGEIIKAMPSVEDIEDEKFENEFTLGIISNEAEAIIRKDLESISEVNEVIFVKVENVEEVAIAAQEETEETKQIDAVHNDEKTSSEDNQNKKSKTGKTVRVDIDRLGQSDESSK